MSGLPLPQLERVNLGRVTRNQALLQRLKGADLISCSGLMDYFETSDVVDIARVLGSHLAAGGKLILFNFSTDNPSRLYMEWIGNWYLIHRTIGDLTEIGRQAGFDASQLSVACDDTGVNLYLTAVR